MPNPVTGVMLVLNEMFYIKASVMNILQFVDELLIMEGGSTDGTKEWLLSLTDPRIKVIDRPQEDKRHYHPSWNQSQRWNELIEKAQNKWVYIHGADECLEDATDLRKLTENQQPHRFPRYNLAGPFVYIVNWYKDSQLRLFDKTQHKGMRFNKQERHCTIVSNMGAGPPILAHMDNTHIIHYHHGLGPKVHRFAENMTFAQMPHSWKHPKHAVEYILKVSPFTYDFSLYGKAPRDIKG